MAEACRAPGPDDPLVRGLLGVVDCNVQGLVHSGYIALFSPYSALSGVLTALLTIYVALIGYRLMTGRTQLSVSEFVINAIKLGAVLALATQWDTYQALVYGVLFRGPQQLAAGMMTAFHPSSAVFNGNVFDGLQTAFDDLNSFGAGFAGHAPPSTAASPMMGGAGFGAVLMNISASILLLSSLGVLLACKIVLGFLLAVGPIFIALLLFDATRGLFEGWLRAALAFAVAPLATTLLLGVALMMLEPSLLQMDELHKRGVYTLGPAYAVMTLILVFAGVSTGALVAAGMIASGFRLPGLNRLPSVGDSGARAPAPPVVIMDQPRAARVAAAATALDRRDTRSDAREIMSSDRRTTVAGGAAVERARDASEPVRLGLQRRASARPRTGRAAAPASSPRNAL